MAEYKYFSTQRPVAPGTFPTRRGRPIKIRNFDSRVEFARWNVWGYLIYDYPLTEDEALDYELTPINHACEQAATVVQ